MKKVMIGYNIEIKDETVFRFVILNFTETDDGHFNLKIAQETLSDLIKLGSERGLQIKELVNE